MKEYKINELVDYIINEFNLDDLLLIEPDRRNELKQYIQNNLSKNKITFVRQESGKQGKPKIYNQDSIKQLIRCCGEYFASLSAFTEDEKRKIIEQYNDFKEDVENSYDPPHLSNEEAARAFKKESMGEEELHYQKLKSEVQRDFINSYEKKKYQVMLEALFRQQFILKEDNLKNDVHNECFYRVYDEVNQDIARSLSRLEDATNYYKCKKNDDE